MEKGYNSDIRLFGDLYHIQTEDWGLEKQLLVTRVFKNGAVIKSFRTPYGNIAKESASLVLRQKIREALKNQHRKILDLLQSGQILYNSSKLGM